MVRYKLELTELQKKREVELKKLGETVFNLHALKNKAKAEEKIQMQLKNIGRLKEDILNKTVKYESLRKEYSNNFVIQKLSDELAESDAIIDQVLVSEKSKSAGKALKDLALPKEALVSAIKRNNEVIIPDGNTRILVNDQVTIIGKKPDVKKVKNRLGSE